MQLDLFNTEELKLVPLPKGSMCGNCTHLFRNYYNKNLKYCGKQMKKHSGQIVFKKIKSRDRACLLFELKNK